jgi:hypothetical protein
LHKPEGPEHEKGMLNQQHETDATLSDVAWEASPDKGAAFKDPVL